MIIVESSGMTDVGMKRTGNEDAFFCDDEMGLYVVADGMGGHNAGEVASKIVVDTFRKQMKRFADNLDTEKLLEDKKELPTAVKRLNTTIHLVNEEIYHRAGTETGCKGMGSTVSAVYTPDTTFVVGNVGDSPVYLIRNGAIRLVSVLHTLMAEYEAMSPDGAKSLAEKYRHVITRAMGTQKTVQPDFAEIQCLKNDIVIICSDGLSDDVTPEEIRDIANNGASEKICKTLVDLAKERGGRDNITVIVLKIIDIIDAGEEPFSGERRIKATGFGQAKEGLNVHIDTDDDSFSAFVLNIDTDGAFVESSDPFAAGSEIHITVSDPDGQNSFMVRGRVDKRLSNGIQVVFENLSEEKKALIKSLKERL